MLIIPLIIGVALLCAWLLGRGRQVRDVSLVFLFCTAIGRPCVIPTGSMEPTIHSWDWIWLSHVSAAAPIHRGDVVCFPGPDGAKLYCKRVIGLGGERLEMRDGHLFVNGVAVAEPWAEKNHDTWTVEVPPGRLFVMGDHRNNSSDSRSWGTVPSSFVTGKAWLVAFPPTHWRTL